MSKHCTNFCLCFRIGGASAPNVWSSSNESSLPHVKGTIQLAPFFIIIEHFIIIAGMVINMTFWITHYIPLGSFSSPIFMISMLLYMLTNRLFCCAIYYLPNIIIVTVSFPLSSLFFSIYLTFFYISCFP